MSPKNAGGSPAYRILAIETSCDETAAAVVADGRHILSNRVASQIELHRRFGGVYPEVASRQHVLAIQTVVEEALADAAVAHVRELDAIAVTNGPGLAGSLLVGVNLAKGLAFASGLPLIPVNHLEGHIYSNWLYTDSSAAAASPSSGDGSGRVSGSASDSARKRRSGSASEQFPALILIVSGGHTELVLMEGHCRYRLLGATLDDAAGEAFDKVARLLELGYPGGPAIQAAAESGDARRFHLPRPLMRPGRRTERQPDAQASPLPTVLPVHGEHRFNFSFSGLKTAVLNLMRQLEREGAEARQAQTAADIASAFQMAVVDALVGKTADAAAEFGVKQVCISGGVSANGLLRRAAEQHFAKIGLPLHCPPLFLCTDNAAMIGAAAYYRQSYAPARQHAATGQRNGHDAEAAAQATPRDFLDLDVYASLPLVDSMQR
ncbi:MAG: tRNA (adenosine(37)-N6)-threonylcarbamoyltransferase complex transferase subunit TsaD [Caldilineaceae bacterium]|nr:tRNA (adenosine(37)-N6)-threonylcarbamoyltransferase complex transferase subunit TsaD [Caldilineaceae bacterium]